MSWRVVLVNNGDYLNLKLDSIVIKKGELDYVIPLSDISIIILEGLNTVVTTRLLNALAQYNINLVICDHKHTPSGLYGALSSHSRASKLLKEQMSWNNQLKDNFWQKIVQMKLLNQLSVMEKFVNDYEYIEKMKGYIINIIPGDKTNREGHAAKIYFNSLFNVEFVRDDSSNIINAGLNYGYSIIRSYMSRLVVGYGLVGMIGLFHKNEYNQFNLVDDLMEPFRQFVDVYVYENFKNKEFMDSEMRRNLVDLVNKQIICENKKTLICNTMENYVTRFISSINANNPETMLFPDINGLFEGVKWATEL